MPPIMTASGRLSSISGSTRASEVGGGPDPAHCSSNQATE